MSKHYETNLMHPYSLNSFQRYQERNKMHHCLTNKTKQTNWIIKFGYISKRRVKTKFRIPAFVSWHNGTYNVNTANSSSFSSKYGDLSQFFPHKNPFVWVHLFFLVAMVRTFVPKRNTGPHPVEVFFKSFIWCSRSSNHPENNFSQYYYKLDMKFF